MVALREQVRTGLLTAAAIIAIVAASAVGLNGWADDLATHTGTSGLHR